MLRIQGLGLRLRAGLKLQVPAADGQHSECIANSARVPLPPQLP